MLVGAVNEVIEKIAVSLDLDAGDDLGESVRHLFEYCKDLLGTPTRETKEANLFQWETSDGNVTLVLAGFRHPGDGTITPCVHLIVASKSYR